MPPNQKRARLSVVPRTPAKTPAKSKVVTAQGLPLNAPASTQGLLRDSYAATAFAEVLDRSLHAAMARFTVGVSPMTLIGICFEASPGAKVSVLLSPLKSPVPAPV